MKSKTSLINRIIVILFLSGISYRIFAQAGTLDPTFSGDGIVTYNFGGIDVAQAMAVDDDGNIFVAGYGVPGASPYKDFAVAKFTSAGDLDPVFGGDGVVTTDFGAGYDDFAYAIAIQPDGKILVAGSTYDGEGNKMCIVRYRGDGSLDGVFGDAGKLIIDFGGPDDAVRAISVLEDDNIIAGGYRMEEVTATMYKRNFAAVKCNGIGILDNGFDFDGKVATPFSSDRHATAFAMGIQTDGKIVLAGYSYVGITANYQIALTRYNGDGSLDLTFDSDGMVLVSTGFALGEAFALQIQSDNKIVVAGEQYIGFDTDFMMMRFNEDGTLDNTFGTAGLYHSTYGGTEPEALNALTILWDGRLVAAGYRGNGSGMQTVLIRCNANGTPDPTFGTDGMVSSDLSDEADGATAILIQSDGKMLVCGYFDRGPDNDFFVARYLSDPTTAIVNNEISALHISPNPVDAYCTIRIPNNGFIEIRDITGKIILSKQVDAGTETFNVESFASGVYSLRYFYNGKSVTERFVKN